MSTIAVGHHPGLRRTAPPGARPHAPSASPPFVLRRVLVLGVLLVVVFGLGVGLGRLGAAVDAEPRVEGSVTIEPGETLWDVAVATSADGVDPRRQLAAIQELNGGLEPSQVRAWTVVLIPG